MQSCYHFSAILQWEYFLKSLYNIKLHLLNPSIFLLHIRSSISYCARKAGRDKRNWWQVTEKWKICDTRRASINELLQSWSKYPSPTAVAFCERLCAKCCCNCHMLEGWAYALAYFQVLQLIFRQAFTFIGEICFGAISRIFSVRRGWDDWLDS